MKRTGLLLLILAFITLGSKCNRDNRIPYVQTNFTLNLNLPGYIDLTVPTGWITVSGGSRGILIYRVNNDTFMAYDRHSTYEVENNCRVDVLDDNITVTDPCSESEWLIIDGSVLSAPATFPLQQYNVSWNPPNLRIYN